MNEKNINEVVSSLSKQWAEAFARQDAEAIAALYSSEAIFYGSTPERRQGPQEIAAYFAAFPPTTGLMVEFSNALASPISSDVINMACLADFSADKMPAQRVRLTWTLVKENQDWKVSMHHASPTDYRPPDQ